VWEHFVQLSGKSLVNLMYIIFWRMHADYIPSNQCINNWTSRTNCTAVSGFVVHSVYTSARARWVWEFVVKFL
jgi:hypothetical protein